MRYIFDTLKSEQNEFVLAISMTDGSFNQSGFGNKDTNARLTKEELKKTDINTVLKNMLDNVRLTVEERQSAEKDLKEFIECLQVKTKKE